MLASRLKQFLVSELGMRTGYEMHGPALEVGKGPLVYCYTSTTPLYALFTSRQTCSRLLDEGLLRIARQKELRDRKKILREGKKNEFVYVLFRFDPDLDPE